MSTLNVGAGQAYATLSAAVAASRDGDVIAVQAGTYVNDFATISTNITIKGVGGMANFVATVPPPDGKGILVTQSNVTIQNLSFSGAAVADNNGAGIRFEGGNLVVIDSYFHDNQMGLLSNNDPNGTIRIVGSEFADTSGPGDGLRHNLYVGNIASLVIDDSYFHDAYNGHQVKSRAQSTTITNSRIYDGTGLGSYSIDLPNGGVGVIRDNVIEQGPNSDNPALIEYSGESAPYAGSSLTITNNVIVNDRQTSGARLLYNNAPTVTANISGNDVYGLTSDQMVLGSATVSGTTLLSARPSLDTTSPWLDTGGSDTIFGTLGADSLAGTTGADVMAGLAGNDTYTVNNVGDVVIETRDGGTDLINSSVNYCLGGRQVEELTLTGSADINGTGNRLDNVFTGNAGDNILNGGRGADTMSGGAGDDVYIVDNIGDVVTESSGGGTDLVRSLVSFSLDGKQVENLTLAGSADIDGTGNTFDNRIVGNGGNNVLNGGGGEDLLTGSGGSDVFEFTSSLVAGNISTITDFSAADAIRLSSATFNTIVGTGALSADQFVANASGTAEDANDRIIFETDTGKLFFDSNGSTAGGAAQFAKVSSDLELTASSFSII